MQLEVAVRAASRARARSARGCARDRSGRSSRAGRSPRAAPGRARPALSWFWLSAIGMPWLVVSVASLPLACWCVSPPPFAGFAGRAVVAIALRSCSGGEPEKCARCARRQARDELMVAGRLGARSRGRGRPIAARDRCHLEQSRTTRRARPLLRPRLRLRRAAVTALVVRRWPVAAHITTRLRSQAVWIELLAHRARSFWAHG